MSTTTDEKPVTRYSGFRRPRSVGLADTSLAASLMWLGNLFVVLVTMSYFPWWVRVLMVAELVVFLGLFIFKDGDGVTQWTRITRRLRYMAYSRTGMTSYQAPLMGKKPVPGVLSQTVCLEYETALGQRFALLHHPFSQQYTAMLISHPDGGERHDRRQKDQRTANWGAFGAIMGNIPSVAQYTVNVESAPRTQMEDRTLMERFISPMAPLTAQQVTRERLAMGVDTHSANTTWITITFNAVEKGTSAKARQENALHIAQLLPGLMQQLSISGAGMVHPATERDIAEYIRAAVDPQSRPIIEAAHAEGEDTGLTWDDCGPSYMDPTWDYLFHNQAWSQTLIMTHAPQGAITSDMLKNLMAPHADVPIKRVTLLKQVIDSGRAAVLTGRDLGTAELRAETQRRSGTARAESRIAARTSDEVAEGHGLEDFTLIVTVTVEDRDQLKRAVEVVRGNLGRAANLRLKPALNQQGMTFWMACPTGFDPWAHSPSEHLNRAATTVK